MKRRIYEILSVSKKKGTASWYFDVFIVTLIVLNVLAIILESVESIRSRHAVAFRWFETFSVIVFTIEYILHVWTANEDPRFKRPVIGNLKFTLTPLAIIDLLAIVPFYLPFFGVDLRLIRVLRMFRLFRIFKVARYVTALSLMSTVFTKKKEELVISLVLTLFLLLIASSLMYYIEHDAQPTVFSSIPETMWWGIATLTTVGYGDVYPITPAGHILGGMIALIGIGLFALPTGILASGFSEELTHRKVRHSICPTCGRQVP